VQGGHPPIALLRPAVSASGRLGRKSMFYCRAIEAEGEAWAGCIGCWNADGGPCPAAVAAEAESQQVWMVCVEEIGDRSFWTPVARILFIRRSLKGRPLAQQRSDQASLVSLSPKAAGIGHAQTRTLRVARARSRSLNGAHFHCSQTCAKHPLQLTYVGPRCQPYYPQCLPYNPPNRKNARPTCSPPASTTMAR
jgi:hypothetical protein